MAGGSSTVFEFDRARLAVGAVADLVPGAPGWVLEIAAGLDMLFAWPCPDAPGLTFAGGLVGGTGVTGIGDDPVAALSRLAGETAEVLALRRAAVAEAFAGTPRIPFPGIDAGDRWIAARDLDDGAAVAVPASLIAGPHGGAPLSEGCAAGASVDAALAHGIFELIERDAACLWWHGGCKGASLEPENGIMEDYTARVRAAKRPLLVELSTDQRLPVAAAVSFEADGRLFCCGTGAGPDLGSAADAALRELHQVETGHHIIRRKLSGGGWDALTPADRREIERASAIDRDAFADAALEGSRPIASLAGQADDGLAVARAALAGLGLRAYWIDLGTVAGLQVVKVVSPDLQPSAPAVRTPRLATLQDDNGGGLPWAARLPLI